jgi:hypothetical protein
MDDGFTKNRLLVIKVPSVSTLFTGPYRKCPEQSYEYANCIRRNMRGIKKDVCKQEMSQLMNCIKKHRTSV